MNIKRPGVLTMCFRSICLFTALLALAGCGSNITVNAEFPRPLVEPLPVDAELQLTDAFRSYTFVEDKEGRRKISIDIGQAHSNLFETLVDGMFASSGDDPQLRLTPTLKDFQYSVPRETRSQIYEIWLKYRIQVETPDGSAIADWLVTGYGKTPTAF